MDSFGLHKLSEALMVSIAMASGRKAAGFSTYRLTEINCLGKRNEGNWENYSNRLLPCRTLRAS
jgi:hypothetical protein